MVAAQRNLTASLLQQYCRKIIMLLLPLLTLLTPPTLLALHPFGIRQLWKLVLPFAQHDLRNALHALCKHGAVSKLLDFQVLATIPAHSNILPALIGKCAALFCRHCVKHIKNSRYCNVARSTIYGRIKRNLTNALLRSIMTVLSLYCRMAL